MNKKEGRISANVEPDVKASVQAHARALDISMSTMIVQALEVEMGDYELREAVTALTRRVSALEDKKATLSQERNALRNELRLAQEKLKITEGDRDEMQTKVDNAEGERDHFKGRFEDSQSELQRVKAAAAAYQYQSWFDKLLGREPDVSPFAEPKRENAG